MWLIHIVLDAGMTASAALARLAANGLWLDADDPAARVRLEPLRQKSGRPYNELAALLQRPASDFGVAIRRQVGTSIIWFARSAQSVLAHARDARPDDLLSSVVDLSGDGDEIGRARDAFVSRSGQAVLTAHGEPQSVWIETVSPVENLIGVPAYTIPPSAAPKLSSVLGNVVGSGGTGLLMPTHRRPKATDPVVVWPRVEAPSWVAAGQEFELVAGFSTLKRDYLDSGSIELPFSVDQPSLQITIELSFGPELKVLGDSEVELCVEPGTVEVSEARFRLVGLEPNNQERACLTTLEVRYVLKGKVCGVASLALAVLPALKTARPGVVRIGTEWTSIAVATPPMSAFDGEDAPDLTLEIFKPDGHVGTGTYCCRLLSPHRLATPMGPFEIELGDDARSFAHQQVDNLRAYSGGALLDLALRSFGQLIAQTLPSEFFSALSEVVALARQQPPSVLIVSAEPFVPWELAWMATPFDTDRPSYLGAQAVVGRWLRGRADPVSGNDAVTRPALHPPECIKVERVAVMAAWYKATDGMCRLPEAEAEAIALVESHGCVSLPAKPDQLRDFLNANIRIGSEPIQFQALHFAGHGTFDPTVPDASALYLEGGTPVRSTLFRAAKYGGERQPLLFLNACLLGIGGAVYNDMGGFPGNSLRGGFGGVLGSLWELDDAIAHEFALEFWRRALPPAPAWGEPIGEILRDLRGRYSAAHDELPIATYLSYVYYGHPRLRLQRAA